MEHVPWSPEWEALIAAHDQALTAQIRRTDLPVLALVGPAPQPAMIGESSGSDQDLHSLTLSYGDLDGSGPLVLVETARPDAHVVPHSLHYLLEVELDRADADAAVSAVETGALVVDGARHPATVQRAGSRFWVARCPYAGCVVTVVARDWALVSTRLAPVVDLEPLLRARTAVIAALRARGPAPEPAVVGAENPRRALVEAVLHDSRHIRQRSQQGLPPRRRDMRVTTGLWSAATEAQMRMTDQARPAANAAVTSMVNQLGSLQEEAGWFATDDRLREGAINETLLYGTGLREAVPSQAAQECWARLWQHQQRPLRPERVLTDRHAWLQAWDTWAREQRGHR